MISAVRLLTYAGPILLILLTAIAGYAYSQISYLSLPIPTSLAVFTVILPVVTGLFASIVSRLLSHKPSTTQRRPFLAVLTVMALQLMYETIVGTLALGHVFPASSLECGLSEQWLKLYRAKNEGAIKRIQDAFDCCGFRSVNDQAWPFPSKKVGAGYCAARYQRKNACEGFWRQSEQVNAGLLFLVAAVIFAIKVGSIVIYFRMSTTRQGSSWLNSIKQLTAADQEISGQANRANTRRLIDEGEAGEPYHDEIEAAPGTEVPDTSNANGGNHTGRVEPGLLDAGEHWREDVEDRTV